MLAKLFYKKKNFRYVEFLQVALLTKDFTTKKVDVHQYFKNLNDWKSFLAFAKKNKLILRLHTVIINTRLSVDVPKKWMTILTEEAREETERTETMLTLLQDVQSDLNSYSVDFETIKTLDGYPDFGKDIDLMILNNFQDAIKVMLNLGFRPIKLPSIRKKCKKFLKKLNSFIITIDLYDKEYTLIGETINWNLSAQIAYPAENLKIGNTFVSIPTPEKTLLIKLNEMYINGQLSLGDLCTILHLIESGDFDWNYVLWAVENSGTNLGLFYLLLVIKQNLKQNNTHINDAISLLKTKNIANRTLIRFSQPEVFPAHFAPSLLLSVWMNKILFELTRKRITNSFQCLILMIYLLYKNSRVFLGSG